MNGLDEFGWHLNSGPVITVQRSPQLFERFLVGLLFVSGSNRIHTVLVPTRGKRPILHVIFHVSSEAPELVWAPVRSRVSAFK